MKLHWEAMGGALGSCVRGSLTYMVERPIGDLEEFAEYASYT